MTYSKPQIIAQNASNGSFASGCPANTHNGGSSCTLCELAR